MKSFFRKIFNAVASFFGDPVKRQKAEEVARQITALADYALPVVQAVAGLTPSPVDDAVIAGLMALNRKAESILNEPDPLVKGGLLLSLASEALRAKLKDMVRQSKEGIQIGSTWLKTAADVSEVADSILRSAAQTAYTLWKATR